MPLAELLAELDRRDIRIVVEGDRLRVDGPKQAITPELRAMLAARKAELVDHFGAAGATSPPRRPGVLFRVPVDEPTRV